MHGTQAQRQAHEAAARLAGRRVLVVGLGRSGLSAARFLAARGIEVAVTDSRAHPPELVALQEELPDVAVFVGEFNAKAFERADLVVVSPGVSRSEPQLAAALAKRVPVVGDVELFAWHADAPVIAISGSNGKSTVTTLVGEMGRAAGREVRVGGNLGTPALELLGESAPDLYVLELSSFQLESTESLNARAATVLNVSADHMDRYADVDAYATAKARIFAGDGVLVLNADDPRVLAMGRPGRPVRCFGLEVPGEGDYGLREQGGEQWLCCGTTALICAAELGLQGRHNLANALAALALADAAGLPRAAQLTALRGFHGLPHRMQWVAEQDGVAWYDDSKGTNVGATLAAVAGAPAPRVVLIAGGEGKGQDFTPLRAALRARGRALVLIGRDAPLIGRAVGDAVPQVTAASMEEAVRRAREQAQPGDAVLLSPACASFDMFSGYQARGDAFVGAVRRLLG